jgi:hypothetical protein
MCPKGTGPTFCTKASERVYIATSSGKDANGESQGAVAAPVCCVLPKQVRQSGPWTVTFKSGTLT